MGKQRATLDLNEDSDIDIMTVLENSNTKKSNNPDTQVLNQVAHASGFVSREPFQKKKRKRSPFVIQTNVKTRPGMKELIDEASERLGCYTQEAVEMAFVSLFEKHQMFDLIKEYQEISK